MKHIKKLVAFLFISIFSISIFSASISAISDTGIDENSLDITIPNGKSLTSRKVGSEITEITTSPIYGNRNNIANKFGVKINYTELDGFTQKEKMNKIDALLSSQGYVPIFLAHGTSNDSSYTHFMIIKGRNNNTDPNSRYIVLDPAGTSSSVAYGVKFKDCPSYSASPKSNTYKYNFDCVKMIYTIN